MTAPQQQVVQQPRGAPMQAVWHPQMAAASHHLTAGELLRARALVQVPALGRERRQEQVRVPVRGQAVGQW